MFLPRSLISTLYLNLQQTSHSLSPPVIILVALEPDALCSCQILTRLLKRDFIPHKIKPIAGYGDLQQIGKDVIRPMMNTQGGTGGVIICLGVGGLVDLGSLIGIEEEGEEINYGGVEIWIIDSRRPWNLANVFGGNSHLPKTNSEADIIGQKNTYVEGGKIQQGYKSKHGGIIVYDDGDIEEDLTSERDAFIAITEMPDIDDVSSDDDRSQSESEEEEEEIQDYKTGQKRKAWPEKDEENSHTEDNQPRQKRRSNSSNPIPEFPSPSNQSGLLPADESTIVTNYSRSVSPPSAQPPSQPSARKLRRRLRKLRRKYETVLNNYYNLGASYSEPISSMMYSLVSELGREDNDLLWMTIVGATSLEIYGRSSLGVALTTENKSASKGWLGTRGSRIRQLLRDEVRRLNPAEIIDTRPGTSRDTLSETNGIIPTCARNPTDTSIRLSPEPKFLLIRHWSLYDSMLHSPYLSARLHIWSENGRKRLHKLLAKMGVSLIQCKQNYTYMDMELKRGLRNKLLKYSEMYGLDDLVPAADTDGRDRGGTKEGWGFVRSWGWRGTFSAQDVGVVIGAILEVGKKTVTLLQSDPNHKSNAPKDLIDDDGTAESEEWVGRFWDAYDALEKIEELKAALPIAQYLHRAIFRTGTSLIEKRQIRHLRAFRMCVVKDGPDVKLFTHPAALIKLALWVGEAISQQEKESKGKLGYGGRGTPLVMASLNESRGVYVVVGTGGGGGGPRFLDHKSAKEKKEKHEAKARAKELKRKNKQLDREQKRLARQLALGDDTDQEDETETEASDSSDSSEDEDEDKEKFQVSGFGRNKFGNAFQEVIEETNTRVRIDNFEHCVVEVKKEDLTSFLESLSMKAVIG